MCKIEKFEQSTEWIKPEQIKYLKLVRILNKSTLLLIVSCYLEQSSDKMFFFVGYRLYTFMMLKN